eukprot:CAMPEP_0182416654 /NCGR_PEP_ID=MMETSP1167-20130531/1029_1 /TAXON_ID=2988 /ORGANISM="Mallomonas Sp, Strain CCMP3275" /LENGTH=261 /DNA_ID=CAMNT_0024589633 /DNA_START=124 /DNA_END=909 /DNA_ORIENTATION=+
MSSFQMSAKDTLYDVPVSNHGARIRMILKAKGLESQVEIVSPMTLGGLKSPEFLCINPAGKMPALVTEEGDNIPESDTIARYVMEKYSAQPPSFIPSTISLKYLSEKISRIHDIYISPIQGAMYKAKGTPFGILGTDRVAGLTELKKQLSIIEKELTSFEEKHPEYKDKLEPFLCGPEISLADATLYPTAVFCMYILPQFFGWKDTDVMGPQLLKWFHHMSSNVQYAKEVKDEIEGGLNAWKSNDRWVPIIEEMREIETVS